MKTLAWMVALMLIASPLWAGNLYKWVDKDGKVHYTDQPPPPDAKTAERKKLGDKPGATQLPYALQMAIKNFPVTLYNADCPVTCPKATALLNKRGVPFTEKSARDAATAEELKALTGGKLVVPVLKVGSQVISGYEEGQWTTVLDAAGYPTSPVTSVRPAAEITKQGQAAPTQAGGAPASSPEGGSAK